MKTHRPIARALDLVTTEEQDEIVVYDERTHHIHHLNATASVVWRMCDGTRTVQQIAASLTGGLPAARTALILLDDARLLDAPLPSAVSLRGSRRDFIRKAGIAAVPAIVSISAPRASAAASGDEVDPSCLPPEHSPTGCWADCGCPDGQTCVDAVPLIGMPGICL